MSGPDLVASWLVGLGGLLLIIDWYSRLSDSRRNSHMDYVRAFKPRVLWLAAVLIAAGFLVLVLFPQ